MIEIVRLYDSFADLLKYPGEGYPQTVERCRLALEEVNAEAAGLLADFNEQIRGSRRWFDGTDAPPPSRVEKTRTGFKTHSGSFRINTLAGHIGSFEMACRERSLEQ